MCISLTFKCFPLAHLYLFVLHICQKVLQIITFNSGLNYFVYLVMFFSSKLCTDWSCKCSFKLHGLYWFILILCLFLLNCKCP